jgi:hypothetical protein
VCLILFIYQAVPMSAKTEIESKKALIQTFADMGGKPQVLQTDQGME